MDITLNLHSQLKDAAAALFGKLEINPGRYSAADVDKTLNLSESGMYYNTNKSNESEIYSEFNAAGAAFGAVNDDAHVKACNSFQNAKNKNRVDAETKQMAAEYAKALNRFNLASEKYNKYESARKTVETLSGTVLIAAGTFTATMRESVVFLKLAEWEKEFKIKTADRAVFVKEEDVTVISSCVLDIPKEVKTLVAYCGNDDLRRVMKAVYLDVEKSSLVATDTRVLDVMEMNVIENNDMPNIIVESNIFKAVAGCRCTVELLDRTDKNIRFTTDKGDIYTCNRINGNYPAYMRVLPKVNRNGLFQLSKESVKDFIAFAKTIARRSGVKKDETPRDPITFSIDAYGCKMTASYCDMNTMQTTQREFDLVGSPKINITFALSAFLLTFITKDWDGCIWFTDKSRPVVFDAKSSRCAIIMPMMCDGHSDACAGEVDALRRHGVSYDIAASEVATVTCKAKTASREISRNEKQESAKRYCDIKHVTLDIVTDDDEIWAVDHNFNRVVFKGLFRCVGSIVVFDRKEVAEADPTDYTEVITEVCALMDVISNAMSAIKKELDDYYLIRIGDPVCACLDLFAEFGAILAMCDKAKEIETIATDAGITLQTEQKQTTTESNQDVRTYPDLNDISPEEIANMVLMEDIATMTGTPELTAVESCNKPPGRTAAARHATMFETLAPPGTHGTDRAPPNKLLTQFFRKS